MITVTGFAPFNGSGLFSSRFSLRSGRGSEEYWGVGEYFSTHLEITKATVQPHSHPHLQPNYHSGVSNSLKQQSFELYKGAQAAILAVDGLADQN